MLPNFTRRQWSTLTIIGLADFANAICVSLQAPFFPQEVIETFLYLFIYLGLGVTLIKKIFKYLKEILLYLKMTFFFLNKVIFFNDHFMVFYDFHVDNRNLYRGLISIGLVRGPNAYGRDLSLNLI